MSGPDQRPWRRAGLLGAAGLLLASACASVPYPTARVASAQSAVRAADEVGAAQIPEAALHLKLARDQVEQANQLLRDGDRERAAQILARATADGELALSIARRQRFQLRAQQAQERLGTLRQ